MLIFRASIITIVLLLLWQAIVVVLHLPPYILPAPTRVILTLIQQVPLLVAQAQPTLIETLLGLFCGIFIGAFSAIILIVCKPLRWWVLPVLVISQAIPTFALAPLLVIWFGYGMASKVAVATIMIFFPVVTTLYDGMQKTPQIWLDLAKTMNASRWKLLWHVQLPAAMPSFASGVRVAAAIAPIGAIVGEWVGASKGLGFLMLNANARLQIDLMFAALLVITVFTLLLYFVIDKTLTKLIGWKI